MFPAAVREDVLGDLYERYSTPARYIASAANLAPRLLLSRIRRTADPRLTLLAFCLIYSYSLAAAWIFSVEASLAALATPAAFAVVTMLVADAYMRQPRPALGAFAGTLVMVLATGRTLPVSVLLAAAVASSALVSLLRAVWMPQTPRPQVAGCSSPTTPQPLLPESGSVLVVALAIVIGWAILKKALTP